MTIRERMLAVYRGELPDRTPVGIYTRYLARGETEQKAREYGLGIIDYAPPVTMLAPPWHVLDGFLSEIQDGGFSIRYHWKNGKRIERRQVEMPEGSLYADIEQDAGGIGSEHTLKHYIETEEDYALAAAAVRRSVFGDNRRMFRARKKALGESGVLLARLDRSPFQKCLLELCAQETFLVDVMDEEDAALALLDILEHRALEAAERVMASEADVIWLPDNITADMNSPALFQKWCLPYYKRVASWAKEAGKPILVHCDGKVRSLVPYLNESGMSAIESLSYPEISGDLTPLQAREAFPGMRILPNFPSNRSYDSAENIEKWVLEQRACLDGVPWMLQLSEDLPASESDKVILAVSRAMAK